MLNNFRKRVSEAINEGISLSGNISTSLSKTSQENPGVDVGIPFDIKIDAGTSLLQENEEIWKHLHESNEINAEKAQDIARKIAKICKVFETLYVGLTTLNATMGKTSQLQTNLNNCIASLDVINKQCEAINERLVEFEDLCEEVDLQEKKLEHKLQISFYKQKKLNELETVRQKLSDEHEKNVRIFETQLKTLQLERQAAFQDAFQLDLELYKKQGSIPKVEYMNSKPQLSLEEVDLDEGEDLEKFLKD